MQNKTYINAQTLLLDSFQLGVKIIQSGFNPDFIVGVWRGGTPVGIAIQEFLDYFGIKTDHIAIRTSSYTGINERSETIRVHGLNYVVENSSARTSLLIADDVHDTGLSIKAVIDTLKAKAGDKAPANIRVATVYYKPGNNKTGFTPDYYIHETDHWLIFPHELDGLTQEEIFEFKPGLKPLFDEAAKSLKQNHGLS
ncbi:MAG: phosphoribosyltransferase family protein [Planctomycetota bacterium]